MNDLELLDKFCETSLDFVHPLIFRDVVARGLLGYVNVGLPRNVQEAKAIVRARLAKDGRCFGDAEIDQIANDIKRMEYLREELNRINLADAHKVVGVLSQMRETANKIVDYYK